MAVKYEPKFRTIFLSSYWLPFWRLHSLTNITTIAATTTKITRQFPTRIKRSTELKVGSNRQTDGRTDRNSCHVSVGSGSHGTTAGTYIRLSEEAAHAMHWYNYLDKQDIYWNVQNTALFNVTSQYRKLCLSSHESSVLCRDMWVLLCGALINDTCCTTLIVEH